MCRYAFAGPYRQPYACFDCRKCFHVAMNWERTPLQAVTHSCPECGQPMHSMGLDFKAPRRHDIRQWRKVQTLYTHGFTYASCGCGAGYRPKRLSELPTFLLEKVRQQEQNNNIRRRAAKMQAQQAKRTERQRLASLKKFARSSIRSNDEAGS